MELANYENFYDVAGILACEYKIYVRLANAEEKKRLTTFHLKDYFIVMTANVKGPLKDVILQFIIKFWDSYVIEMPYISFKQEYSIGGPFCIMGPQWVNRLLKDEEREDRLRKEAEENEKRRAEELQSALAITEEHNDGLGPSILFPERNWWWEHEI